ncbi:MAG: cupin domain-containing protein [Bdellovibrionales bacterium]|jgi:quercetin dioxygenase-like cupin family protein|nr:cupin domain-containing protein [Bdellovibrionales bacterium]
MIIQRWQAPLNLTQLQARLILENEGLEPYEEVFGPHEKIREHKHPFSEVRVVISGEMLFNISGNQFSLRPGDRVEVPANTKHSHSIMGGTPCCCVCAERII